MMLRAALGFFTRLPIGSAPLPPTFRGVAVWLPVVGLIIGALATMFLSQLLLKIIMALPKNQEKFFCLKREEEVNE